MEPIAIPDRLKQKLQEIAHTTQMLQSQGNALIETFLEAKGIPLDTKIQLAPDFSAILPVPDSPVEKK